MWPSAAFVIGSLAATMCLAWGSVKFRGLTGIRRWLVLGGTTSALFLALANTKIIDVYRPVIVVAILLTLTGVVTLLEFVSKSYTGLTNDLERLREATKNDV